MTDDQIVKALEICNSLSQRCGNGCPYYTVIYKNGKRCSEMMIDDTLALIKRQQAEIKELQEILGGTSKVQSQTCAVVRAEAVREFAEKLKSKFASIEYQANTIRKTVRVDELKAQMDWILHEIVPQAIGDLVIEMTEKEGGKV